MASTPLPLLNLESLRPLAAVRPAGACQACAPLVCPGWESLPGDFDRARLQRVGTLQRPDDEEPTLVEHHPDGTHAWSVDAPIAPAFFPYNRCEAWRCTACARPFLRYTEYGGYYQDERIRELDARLLVDARP
ncbi:hypothetical protein C7444_10938 [Sphaerotilus hippei]|uniref:Uncharacterized protein n=1 Tax=Sphaerotilus hippei TaxID=744406 RepID=A0A318H210_9BURK|nr:hypothetical protein [Sphaerotilus hippei]PXW95470.1 hypothetical protein C7444_10938 [Sphaerotilus hippei]